MTFLNIYDIIIYSLQPGKEHKVSRKYHRRRYLSQKKRRNKTEDQTRHVIRRFAERFNVLITPDDISAIIKNQIQNQQAKFVFKQSLRTTVWEIIFQGRFFLVVYDKIRKSLVTVLPDGNSLGYEQQTA